ncbi:hypothetical protein WC434_12825, partial [Bordetella avium]|uniref:hypothetical protein n=1 Tax=Bordetella avium TaxID=521 RepID=UPI00307CF90C
PLHNHSAIAPAGKCVKCATAGVLTAGVFTPRIFTPRVFTSSICIPVPENHDPGKNVIMKCAERLVKLLLQVFVAMPPAEPAHSGAVGGFVMFDRLLHGAASSGCGASTVRSHVIFSIQTNFSVTRIEAYGRREDKSGQETACDHTDG